nr:MAG TPA: hypothetical protein [Caudoviricetes sp.]
MQYEKLSKICIPIEDSPHQKRRPPVVTVCTRLTATFGLPQVDILRYKESFASGNTPLLSNPTLSHFWLGVNTK